MSQKHQWYIIPSNPWAIAAVKNASPNGVSAGIVREIVRGLGLGGLRGLVGSFVEALVSLWRCWFECCCPLSTLYIYSYILIICEGVESVAVLTQLLMNSVSNLFYHLSWLFIIHSNSF